MKTLLITLLFYFIVGTVSKNNIKNTNKKISIHTDPVVKEPQNPPKREN